MLYKIIKITQNKMARYLMLAISSCVLRIKKNKQAGEYTLSATSAAIMGILFRK